MIKSIFLGTFFFISFYNFYIYTQHQFYSYNEQCIIERKHNYCIIKSLSFHQKYFEMDFSKCFGNNDVIDCKTIHYQNKYFLINNIDEFITKIIKIQNIYLLKANFSILLGVGTLFLHFSHS